MDTNESETTWAKTLSERVKSIQDNKELWCPQCAKFTPCSSITFHGKNEKGEKIESFKHEDIFEYEGYIYTCLECGFMHEGMNIGKIQL